MKTAKILVYDDEKLEYFVGSLASIETISGQPIEFCTIGSNFEEVLQPMYNVLKCDILNGKKLQNIELDDTTMKRILRFNKEIEIKKLDEKIKEKRKEINDLDNILQDKDNKVEKIKKFIANIYDIDIDEDDYNYNNWNY